MQWWYEIEMPDCLNRPREVAELLAAEGVPDSLKGLRVVALCRRVTLETAPFAEMFVEQLLVDREAADLVLVASSDELLAWCERAAARRGLAGRVHRLRYNDLVA
jgi:hypothetical protein